MGMGMTLTVDVGLHLSRCVELLPGSPPRQQSLDAGRQVRALLLLLLRAAAAEPRGRRPGPEERGRRRRRRRLGDLLPREQRRLVRPRAVRQPLQAAGTEED